jgi:hypothetical protein
MKKADSFFTTECNHFFSPNEFLAVSVIEKLLINKNLAARMLQPSTTCQFLNKMRTSAMVQIKISTVQNLSLLCSVLSSYGFIITQIKNSWKSLLLNLQ